MSNLVLAKKSHKPNLKPNRNPNRFKDSSQKLFGPTGIAVLASVGIHGLLAVILPYMGNTDQSKPAPKTVQLVQLSPAELSRLPQTVPPPALGLNQLQGLNPLPGLSTPYPPLTGLGLPSNLSPVNPPLNGLANNTKSPTTKATPSAKTDPKTKPTADKNTKITERKLALSQGPVRIQAARQQEKFSSGGNIPNLNLTAADYAPANPPLPPPSLYPPAPINQTASQQVAPPSRSSNSPQFSPQPQARGNSRTPEPLVSPNVIISSRTNPDTASSPSQDLVGIKPATGTPALPTTPDLSKPNGVDGGKGTSNDDYNRRSIDALARMGDIAKVEKYATISGSSITACMEKMSGTALITAEVDAQGTVGSATVTKPSTSSVLDDVARTTVSGINFGAKGKPMAYQVPVEFKYDPGACGNATPQTTKTQSTPTSQNSPASKITPATPPSSPIPKK